MEATASRRRFRRGPIILVVGVGIALVIVIRVGVPIAAGYLGAEPAVFADVWRPWRTGVKAEIVRFADRPDPGGRQFPGYEEFAYGYAEYTPVVATDPMVDTPGYQTTLTYTLGRKGPRLPWEIIEVGTGP